MSFKHQLLCLLSIAGTVASSTSIDTGGIIQAQVPAGIFTETEHPSFTLRPESAVAVSYRIFNAHGTPVTSGNWPEQGKGTLKLDRLPRGYYTIRLTGVSNEYTGFASFGVVAEVGKTPANPDMFFAIDTAQSWCAVGSKRNTRFPGDGFKTVTEAARRAGLAWVRDRMSWRDIEPSPEQYRWCQYLPNGWLLGKHGIKVSNTYHDAPQWSRKKSKDLPDDLLATYRFARKISRSAKGCTEAWEFWNEEDAGFTVEGAWDYAANLKAASLGFRAGNPQARILNGSFCVFPIRDYADIVMKNDAANYIDTFNFHTYKPIADYPELVAGLKKFLAAHGVPDLPIWFTENGTQAPGAAATPSYYPDLKSYSPEQEMVVAEFIPKAQITMQNLGVERDFFFLLSPYNEGTKDWGLLRKDYTVRPGYFAFATMVKELGRAVPQGTLVLGKNIRAYLYRQPDGMQTVVLWSLSDIDTRPNDEIDVQRKNLHRQQVVLPAQAGSYTVRDLFGTPSTVKASNGKLLLTVTREPGYIHGLSGLVPAVPAPKPGKPQPKPTEADRTVILRPELSDDFMLSSGRNSVDLKGKSGKLTLQVYNLSDTPKTGTITVKGGTVSGLPETVSVAAFSKIEIPLEFTPALRVGEFRGAMEFGGIFNNHPLTRLHVPLFLFTRSVASGRILHIDGIYKPERWRNNSSGKMKTSYDKTEKAIRFDVEFPQHGDRWIYPEYILDLPGESFKGARGVAFEMKTTPSMPQESVFMAVMSKEKEHGKAVYIRFPMPDTEWEERLLCFDEFVPHPENIEMFRLGENPLKNNQTFWIRNLRIFYDK